MLSENEMSTGYDIVDAIIALGTGSLHIYFGDAIFDQAYNKSFHESLESAQYHASLAITRAIRLTKEKIYE